MDIEKDQVIVKGVSRLRLISTTYGDYIMIIVNKVDNRTTLCEGQS